MIRPPGFRGAAFTDAADGDMRSDDRLAVAAALGVPSSWAEVRQVHGADLIEVSEAGVAADADGLWTSQRDLPLAVFTADCGGVVLEAGDATAVVHAGWRGAAAGVVGAAAAALGDVERAALGPTIGPCCFEVGDEVAARFAGDLATTTWGTVSVDLPSAIRRQVPGAEWWSADACTRCGAGWFSHRRDRTPARMAALGWLP